MQDSHLKRTGIEQVIWFILFTDHNIFFSCSVFISEVCKKSNMGVMFHIKITMEKNKHAAIESEQ